MKQKVEFITIYEIIAARDDRSNCSYGTWLDRERAEKDAIGIGWYNADGRVNGIPAIVNEDGRYFRIKEVTPVGIQPSPKKMIDDIKGKLTEEEIEFLGLDK